ncbi:unnamed protein product [Onchocerca flexuosa]|uniref:Secreted protein n=1 Tax=Onchocerca flexuosa TaxID=387005 RepID=A0A183H8I3_9BILA|nr:unnamed protein product [Onchocerca flexuosa]
MIIAPGWKWYTISACICAKLNEQFPLQFVHFCCSSASYRLHWETYLCTSSPPGPAPSPFGLAYLTLSDHSFLHPSSSSPPLSIEFSLIP